MRITVRKTSNWKAFVLALVITILTVGNIVLANGLPPPTFYTEFNNAPEGRPYYVILFANAPDYSVDFIGVGVHGTMVDAEMMKNTSIREFLDSYEDPDKLLRAPNPIIMCEGDTYNGYFVPYLNGTHYRFVIYWDDTGEYKITEVFELARSGVRYGVDLSEEGDVLSVRDVSTEHDIKTRLPGTLFRLVMTRIGEFIIALFYGFFKKKELLTVIITNVVSNLIAQAMSLFLFGIYFLGFLIIEGVVIVAEYFVYRKFFDEERSNGRIWGYSIVANLVTAAFSFIVMCFQLMVMAYAS